MRLVENVDMSKVEPLYQSTRGITGFFEVTVNGTLVFSKKQCRHFPREDDLRNIVEAVRSELLKSDAGMMEEEEEK
eukprot:m.92624 g.92624  ORF g.92624 m.92624 type:complete len:76 (+) comp8896_c5_seq1:113-340(+)